MNILFLSHKIPYPPNKGDKIPIFYRLGHLSKSHKIHMIFPCFYKEELGDLDVVKKYCASVNTELLNPLWQKIQSLFYIISDKPLSLPYFYSKKLHKKISHIFETKKIDIVYVFSSAMAQYVLDIKGIKKVIDFVDSDAHKWMQYSERANWPFSWIYYREWLKMRKFEIMLGKTFDCSISISEDEKKLFLTYDDVFKSMVVVPNGVNCEYFHFNNTVYNPKKLIFVGAMDYYANVDAVLYFYNKIFPLIKEKEPSVVFYVVGSRPVKPVLRLKKDPGVVVTGSVDDVRKFLNDSCAAVVPMRMARGMQNKILEAMSAGVPVVTTIRGNEGVNAKEGEEIFVHDNPQEFADAVLRLMADPQLRASAAAKARQLIENKFRWESSLKKLEDLLLAKHE